MKAISITSENSNTKRKLTGIGEMNETSKGKFAGHIDFQVSVGKKYLAMQLATDELDSIDEVNADLKKQLDELTAKTNEELEDHIDTMKLLDDALNFINENDDNAEDNFTNRTDLN